eukprot:3801342-Rhodomonas_salina.1
MWVCGYQALAVGNVQSMERGHGPPCSSLLVRAAACPVLTLALCCQGGRAERRLGWSMRWRSAEGRGDQNQDPVVGVGGGRRTEVERRETHWIRARPGQRLGGVG